MIPELNSSFFTWELWRAGSLVDLGLVTRYWSICSPEGMQLIRKYAIGYCDGSGTVVRGKPGTIAVMFFKDGEHFWSHFMLREFEVVFEWQSLKQKK
jgi:hypothetical protein